MASRLIGLLLAALGAFLLSVPVHAETPSKPGTVFRDCAEGCPDMVILPAGAFLMGSTPEDIAKYRANSSAGDEGPQHRVTFARPFAMGRYTVTRGEYARFVRETGYVAADDCTIWTGRGTSPLVPTRGMDWEHNPVSTTDRQPAVCLTYADQMAYVDWLSAKTGRDYRLPSEAEWEYGARGGTQTLFSFGNNPDDLCTYGNVDDQTVKAEAERTGTIAPVAAPGFPNCSDGVGLRTAEVGRYKPNGYGLYDMFGNVWERTADCYHASYAGAPVDGTAWMATGVKNGNGAPVDCNYRVMRGGGWRNAVFHFRPANRYDGYSVYFQGDYEGFRVARSLETPTIVVR